MSSNTKNPIPKFKDPNLLKQAFTHRSVLNEKKTCSESNERLEYLGDAVLELVSSEYLYHKYPEYPEGKLTSLRAKIVQTSTLAWAANNLLLDQQIKLSKGENMSGGNKNPSILADTYEALVGAIYIDSGYQKAKKFICESLILPFFANIKEVLPHDYKSQLQELVQADKLSSPIYKSIIETGPDHDKIFTIAVIINNKKVAIATGKSKQRAEQAAAQKALAKKYKKP